MQKPARHVVEVLLYFRFAVVLYSYRAVLDAYHHGLASRYRYLLLGLGAVGDDGYRGLQGVAALVAEACGAGVRLELLCHDVGALYKHMQGLCHAVVDVAREGGRGPLLGDEGGLAEDWCAQRGVDAVERAAGLTLVVAQQQVACAVGVGSYHAVPACGQCGVEGQHLCGQLCRGERVYITVIDDVTPVYHLAGSKALGVR